MKTGKLFLYVCIILFAELTVWCDSVIPQEQQANHIAPYVVTRINSRVTLDGISDEPAWEGIESLPLVAQYPNFGDKPSERTEILLGYDDDYLYLAGRFYVNHPSDIISTSLRRDDIKPGTDSFGIVIDTFNDNENAVVFMSTPAGLRSDFAAKTLYTAGYSPQKTQTQPPWIMPLYPRYHFQKIDPGILPQSDPDPKYQTVTS